MEPSVTYQVLSVSSDRALHFDFALLVPATHRWTAFLPFSMKSGMPVIYQPPIVSLRSIMYKVIVVTEDEILSQHFHHDFKQPVRLSGNALNCPVIWVPAKDVFGTTVGDLELMQLKD